MSWEDPLLDQLNAIQGSRDKRHNLRLDRDKLSSALQKACGNDAITHYFKLEQV